MTTLGSYKVGGVTGSISTSSPGKYTVSLGLGGNANAAAQQNQSQEPVTETETMTFTSNKPVAQETVTVGLGKPTGFIRQGDSRAPTVLVSGGVETDGGVKSVAAQLLSQYDKRNTGGLDNGALKDLLSDVYKILGESFFPKQEDVDGLARVLDVNKDGQVGADDIEAICQRYLGKKTAPAVRKGEQAKSSGIREEEEKPLPPEIEFKTQIFDATKIFEKFDSDKSGFLEEDEIPFVLEETYKKIGIKKVVDHKQIKTYIHALDSNGDGKISLEEFIKVLVDSLLKEKQKYKPTGVSYTAGGYQRAVIKTDLEKAREIFDRHDSDKSGFLEPNEIPAVLKEMLSSINIKREIKDSDVQAYLKSFDKNIDQKISFEEFSRLVNVARAAK